MSLGGRAECAGRDGQGREDFPATLTHTVPDDGTYLVVGGLLPTGNATWDVSCSPATPSDSDGDGVPDADDACPATVLPDEPTNRLKGARFSALGDGTFDSGLDRLDGLYTLTDTAGGSATDIIVSQGLGAGDLKFGLSRGALEDFIAGLASDAQPVSRAAPDGTISER